MTEGDKKVETNEKVEEWKYDFAWLLRDITQQVNDRIEQKAMNLINFIGLLIPIITGAVLFSVDKDILSNIRIFWAVSLIPLFFSIVFAFKTVWLTDQGIINAENHLNKCSSDPLETILKNTAHDIAYWQSVILEAKNKKVNNFLRSSYLFMLALIMIIVSPVCLIL